MSLKIFLFGPVWFILMTWNHNSVPAFWMMTLFKQEALKMCATGTRLGRDQGRIQYHHYVNFLLAYLRYYKAFLWEKSRSSTLLNTVTFKRRREKCREKFQWLVKWDFFVDRKVCLVNFHAQSLDFYVIVLWVLWENLIDGSVGNYTPLHGSDTTSAGSVAHRL